MGAATMVDQLLRNETGPSGVTVTGILRAIEVEVVHRSAATVPVTKWSAAALYSTRLMLHVEEVGSSCVRQKVEQTKYSGGNV